MTQHCCVRDCRHNKRTSACTFKRFPTDPQKSKLWETLVERFGSSPGGPVWKRHPSDRICECHFEDDQFERNRQDGLRRLRWDAVPTLFGGREKIPEHRTLPSNKPLSAADFVIVETNEDSSESSPAIPSDEDESAKKDEEGEDVKPNTSEVQVGSDLTSFAKQNAEANVKNVSNTLKYENILTTAGSAKILKTEDAADLMARNIQKGIVGGEGCAEDTEDIVPDEETAEPESITADIHREVSVIEDTSETVTNENSGETHANEDSAEANTSEDKGEIGASDVTEETYASNDTEETNAGHDTEESNASHDTDDIESHVDTAGTVASQNSGEIEITEHTLETAATQNTEDTAEPEGSVCSDVNSINDNSLSIDTSSQDNAEVPSGITVPKDTQHDSNTGGLLSSESSSDEAPAAEVESAAEENSSIYTHEEVARVGDLDEDDEVLSNADAEEGNQEESDAEEADNESQEICADRNSEEQNNCEISEIDEGGNDEQLVSQETAQEDVNSEQGGDVTGAEGIGQEDNGEDDNVDDDRNIDEEGDDDDGAVHEEDIEDDGEDDGEGEDFEAEEDEEFEDGEEIGEEVEVEIEDCSDPEMEPDGGVTYIISEGMIVVEENESLEAFQTSEEGTTAVEEYGAHDDQTGNVLKTKRIVIKVPASKNLIDTEKCSSSAQISVQETASSDEKSSSEIDDTPQCTTSSDKKSSSEIDDTPQCTASSNEKRSSEIDDTPQCTASSDEKSSPEIDDTPQCTASSDEKSSSEIDDTPQCTASSDEKSSSEIDDTPQCTASSDEKSSPEMDDTPQCTEEVPLPMLQRNLETVVTNAAIDVTPSTNKNLVNYNSEFGGMEDECSEPKDKCISEVQPLKKRLVESDTVMEKRATHMDKVDPIKKPEINIKISENSNVQGVTEMNEQAPDRSAKTPVAKVVEEIPKPRKQPTDGDFKASKSSVSDKKLIHSPTRKEKASKECEEPPKLPEASSEKKASTKTRAHPKESTDAEVSPGATKGKRESTQGTHGHLVERNEEKHGSKSGRSTSHKHKKETNKEHIAEKTSSSVKARKSETDVTQEHSLKSDLNKKVIEGKEVVSRSAHKDIHKKSTPIKETATPSHRTRSNSVTSKERSSKERRTSNSHKEESTTRKSTSVSGGSDDAPNSNKANSDGKSALRSSRSRKLQADPRASQELSPVKKEKVKASSETPVRPRQSERVSKATEKAIASGMVPRRSRNTTVESSSINSAKSQGSDREEQTSSLRRGKRKAEPCMTKEEPATSKRRTTRSSETTPSNDPSQTITQSLRSVRKTKPLKRKASSNDLPPAKQAHTEETSAKEKVPDEFIASIPKICRICGSKNDSLLNVFGPEGRTMKLAEKVQNILSIKISEDEPLPSGVCHSCVVTLIACEKLVENSTSIDKRLRAHFNCPIEKQKAQQKMQSANTEKHSVKAAELSSSHSPIGTSEAPRSSSNSSLVSSAKPGTVTRTSSRVSSKVKLAGSPQKVADVPPPSNVKATPSQDMKDVAASKGNLSSNAEVEDSPPILEAEPPQSHLPPLNQEPSAQPPVLVPQPGKPLPELVPIPADDPSSAKRFGNTYRARMKPGQWEKIERGLEAIHGQQLEEEYDNEPSDVKPSGLMQTEEFHIVGLEMNVEEVPPEAPSAISKATSSKVSTELHVEILPEAAPEESAVQSSSPKSVIDSILVDWSGDEDDIGPVQRGTIVSSDQHPVGKSNINGSSQSTQSTLISKTPCLFGDDEDGYSATKTKLSLAAPVVVKQESFWPDPAPGMSTTETPEKHPNDVPWKCFVCGKRGKSVPKFLEHKKLHLNDRKLVSCPKCSESFTNLGLLKAHTKSHHGDDDEEEMVIERQIKQNRKIVAVQNTQDTIVDIDLTPATDGLYHCSLCLSAFTNIESLCQHKLIHQSNETALYKCAVCRRTFFQNKDFQEHLATHQSGAQNLAQFQCAKCDMRVSSQKEFIEHIQTHNPEEHSYKCDMCNKIFDTKHKLRSHRSTVHKSTAYACHLCDKVCQKRITLVEHLRKHTGDNPFACPVCSKRFNRLANYKAHMTIHENARRYECPYCGKRFNRQSIQQRHIKTHTNEQSRKHRCRVCNLTFGLATEMFTHRKLHTREEVERANWEDEKQRMALTSFPCKVCQMPFNTVEEVLAHMPHHTNDERDVAVKLKNPRLECDICGKVLNSKRTFNAHRSSHIDGKPFVCKICSKGYSTGTGLNYHMLSHTGERPFPCSFCNKGYKNSTDLKVHMRQHTGEFPYKCNLCNKAFRSASSLQKHGFVHSEARPFKCQYCNMSFKREGTKLNHERIHTNDRRFKCKVCSRAFVQKAACEAHEKLHFRGSGLYASVDGTLITSQNMAMMDAVVPKSSGTEKHDLFEDFEEEEFDEDDDDEDEYIIYEDDSVEDGDAEEKDEEEKDDVAGNDPLKASSSTVDKASFEEPTKSSNGVDLPATSIAPIAVAVSGDSVPSVGDSSVHITIL